MAINMMCMNSECKYYWEDCCTRNIQEERIVINAYGECETFEKGVSDWYLEPMAYDYYNNPITEGTIIEQNRGYKVYFKAVLKEDKLVLENCTKEVLNCQCQLEIEDIEIEQVVNDPRFEVHKHPLKKLIEYYEKLLYEEEVGKSGKHEKSN